MPVPLSSPVAANAPPPVGAVGKRARVSERKRHHAKELQQQLELLRDLYGGHHGVGELRDILDKAITSAHRFGESTRAGDRNRVLQILHTWDVVELEELLEEADLSRWVFDQILKDPETRKLIRTTPEASATPSGGRPRHLYKLTAAGREYCDRTLPAQIKN